MEQCFYNEICQALYKMVTINLKASRDDEKQSGVKIL